MTKDHNQNHEKVAPASHEGEAQGAGTHGFVGDGYTF